jgi:crotonobetainyl-CoA:carnitine CoA-transferase CaiB-like acyl-CoA transferase
MHAAFAVLTALEHRSRTGEGQQIELSFLETAANIAAEQVIEYNVYDHLMTRHGSRDPEAAPQGSYSCAEPETWVALSVRSDDAWGALVSLVAEPALRDPDFATMSNRHQRADLIDTYLEDWFRSKSAAKALELLHAAGVPAELVVHAYDVDTDTQMNARHFWEDIDHPVAGSIRYPGWPMRLRSRSAPWYRTPSPLLGQHTEVVLTELLGLSSAEIGELREEQIIGDRPLGL